VKKGGYLWKPKNPPMKKIYVLALVLVLCVSFGKAQTTLTTAVDFTVTDTDGNSHNLFNILNSGKYVCLDFFFTTCGPCQATCPYYKQTFTNYGCNTQDVYFMSIDNGNSDAECEAYETTFLGGSAGFPAISGNEGGGNAVVAAYGISAFPTYILIAPSHAIIEQDMWPISSAADFDTYFNAHSLVYKACASGIEENAFSGGLSIYPNPASERLIIETSNGEMVHSYKIVDVLGRTIAEESIHNTERYEINISTLATGMYYLEVLSAEGSKALEKFSKK
jgi:cytochrome oxidase Cu insertion factor (SCO1/SenC/PrrC family)